MHAPQLPHLRASAGGLRTCNSVTGHDPKAEAGAQKGTAMEVLALTRAGVPKQLFASSLQQQYMQAPARQGDQYSEPSSFTGYIHDWGLCLHGVYHVSCFHSATLYLVDTA